MIKFKKQSLAASAPSGTLADEAISSIRNATAFNTQEKLATQYDAYLAKVGRVDFKVRCVVSVTIAFIIGASQLNYVSILVPKKFSQLTQCYGRCSPSGKALDGGRRDLATAAHYPLGSHRWYVCPHYHGPEHSGEFSQSFFLSTAR